MNDAQDRRVLHWSVKRLSDVFEVQLGKMLSAKARGGESPRPYIRNKNVQWGRIDTTEVIRMDFDQREMAKFRLRKGDLLMCEGGEPGRTAIWRDEIAECYYQKAIHRLRPLDGGALPEFYLYWFRYAFDITNHYGIAGASSTIAHLPAAQLKSLELPVPSLAEQRQIARVLSAVQRAIGRQERLIALTAELKNALMHKLFTEGTRGEQLKPVRFGTCPASWSIAPLGECCEVQTGIAKGRAVRLEDAVAAPYLRVANVQDGHLNLRDMKTITIRKAELERFSLRRGDVVLTEGGDLDKLGRGFIWNGEIAECVHQNHVFAVRPDLSKLSSEFIAYQTQSPYGKAYFLSVAHKTTNLACINTSKLKAFPVLLPTNKEQEEIVSILQSLDRRRDVTAKTLALMQSLFRTLLHQLMTAQMRVHDLDVSALDELAAEPAGVA